MKHPSRLLAPSFCIALCALTVAAAAQDAELMRRAAAPTPATILLSDPVPPQPQQPVLLDPITDSIGEAIGFGHVDGQLVGIGPRYRVLFGEHGPRITTPLGAQAERSLPLSFELESIRRGEQQLASGGAATPVRQGDAVVYARGATIDERYDLRLAGVEQSFVIDSLPAGEGDLVVRGRLTSELDAPTPGVYPDGLSFRAPQWNGSTQGGVEIGRVIGIDAAGARVPGLVSWDGSHIEYSLPAEFVSAARLPLVVDPLFGGGFAVADSADFADPDVAWDETNAVYLVVFERQWSGTDVDIYGRLMHGNGTPFGGLIAFEPLPETIGINPSVANVNAADRFFIAWQQSDSILGPWDVYGLALENWGLISPTIALATDISSEIEPDVAGARSAPDQIATVVWERFNGGISGASVDVSVAGMPTIASTFTLTEDPLARRPSISQGPNAAGLYVVVYSKFFTSPPPGDHDLFGAMIDALGVHKTGQIHFLLTFGPDEDNAEVVAGPDHFAVVFESRDSLNDLDRGVHCLRLQPMLSAQTLWQLGTTVVVEDDALNDERGPVIAYTGLKYHVAYLDQRADFGYDLALRELDPADCLPCSQKFGEIGSSTTSLFAPALTSRSASSSTTAEDECLLVYESVFSPGVFFSKISGQLWESIGPGGLVWNLGGGCAGGGTAGTVGPLAPGSPTVTLTLTGAAPTAVLGIVNLNPGPAALFPCGSCLAPLPGILINRPIVAGNSSLFLPTPCDAALVGAVLDFDWKVVGVPTSPCPLVANLANSNVLRLTIGQ